MLPADLATLRLACETLGGSSGLSSGLVYLACALQHRLRFEVELDEPATIQAGQFDIEVEMLGG
jgi:hypothetical protein